MSRSMETKYVLRGSPLTIKFEHSGSEVDEIVDFSDGIITVNEEIEKEEYVLGDRQKKNTVYGRKVIVEGDIDEIRTSKIAQISNADYFLAYTNTGGELGQGVCIQVSASDNVEAYLQDSKTHFMVEKSYNPTQGLPYSIGYVSASTYQF